MSRSGSSIGAPPIRTHVLTARISNRLNILKDAPDDAKQGRVYLPPSVGRAEVARLARDDLRVAERYVDELLARGAAPGTIAFCTLPRKLAVATLDALDAGKPKLTRDEVAAILSSCIS
jgi:farnesyl-diphosphate farnesyltransferase